MRGPSRVRSLRRAAGAVAALLLLGGCAQNAPAVAAEVGGDAITDEQVDQLAEALCVLSAGAPAGTPPATGQQTRRQALQVLLDNELAEDVIDPDSVDDEQVAAARQQAAESLEALPERLRPVFDDAVADFATTQLGLAALGRESLREQGEEEPAQEAALAEGQRLLQEHAAELDVSVDPRFGVLEEGRLGPSDGSLSVAVSEEAKASSAGDAVGSDLPANLTCNAG